MTYNANILISAWRTTLSKDQLITNEITWFHHSMGYGMTHGFLIPTLHTFTCLKINHPCNALISINLNDIQRRFSFVWLIVLIFIQFWFRWTIQTIPFVVVYHNLGMAKRSDELHKEMRNSQKQCWVIYIFKNCMQKVGALTLF